jgi:hypothetical protein
VFAKQVYPEDQLWLFLAVFDFKVNIDTRQSEALTNRKAAWLGCGDNGMQRVKAYVQETGRLI